MAKFITKEEAANKIKDGDTIIVEGFIGSCVADEVHEALSQRYEKEQHPQQLTLIHAAGIGNAKDKGMNYYAHQGMVKRIIGGHWAMAPQLHDLVENDQIEAYNFPQGVIAQLMRETAAKRPYLLTTVGLNTFVDPSIDGGKLNQKTTEDLVEKINLDGTEYLAYKTFKPNVAIIRGSFSDRRGNISFEKEALTLEATAEAMAVKNHGGIVIVQVESIVENGTLNPKLVKIPSVLVDYVVVAQNKDNHRQTYATSFHEGFISSDLSFVKEELTQCPLNIRKVIARQASQFLPEHTKVINYGIGIPEVVAQVLKEEGLDHQFMNTVEPGTFGGASQGGMDFGASLAPEAVVDQPYMFDFYDGGGIDIAFLGMAECDEEGNINVSKFGSRIAGAGGFINISQNTPVVVFCGTFTAGSLNVDVSQEGLHIQQEGKNQKFVKRVQHITFSAKNALKQKQHVYYVTERAVFQLKEQGMTLIYIAPGIDLQKDILDQMAFDPIIDPQLKEMDRAIFSESLMANHQ